MRETGKTRRRRERERVSGFAPSYPSQSTGYLEFIKKFSLPCSLVALAEINLGVIEALLESDFLAQNLELEPRNHGRCTQTFF